MVLQRSYHNCQKKGFIKVKLTNWKEFKHFHNSKWHQQCTLPHQLKCNCSRLEMDYVSGLEKLATQLEEETVIIREFLAKNYGHFDSRWWCWDWSNLGVVGRMVMIDGGDYIASCQFLSPLCHCHHLHLLSLSFIFIIIISGMLSTMWAILSIHLPSSQDSATTCQGERKKLYESNTVTTI